MYKARISQIPHTRTQILIIGKIKLVRLYSKASTLHKPANKDPSQTWAPSCKMVTNGPSCCHTKRRMGTATLAHPSFGMTATEAIGDHFA